MFQHGKRKTKTLLDFLLNRKSKVYLRTLCAFSILVKFSKIRSCKVQTGVCVRQPSSTLSVLTALIRRDISPAWFRSCKLLWHSDEFVLLAVLTRGLIFLQLWTAVS